MFDVVTLNIKFTEFDKELVVGVMIEVAVVVEMVVGIIVGDFSVVVIKFVVLE